MHPFFLFLILILSVLIGLFCAAAGFFYILKLWVFLFDKIMYARLKCRIRGNPGIGVQDEEGNAVVKDGRYTIAYRVCDASGRCPRISFVSLKRRLWGYEMWLARAGRTAGDFWLYREWEYFFEPRVFLTVAAVLLVLYFAVYEPLGFKMSRARWFIANVVGLPLRSVTVEPGGWIVISGQRKTADNTREGVSYHVNPLKWLVSSDGGYVVRNMGDSGGTVTYPVKYGTRGDVEIKKDGSWVKASVAGDTIQLSGERTK